MPVLGTLSKGCDTYPPSCPTRHTPRSRLLQMAPISSPPQGTRVYIKDVRSLLENVCIFFALFMIPLGFVCVTTIVSLSCASIRPAAGCLYS